MFSCESAGFRPDVVYGPTVSRTNDRGVAQINVIHAWRFAEKGWDYFVDAFVPERNLAVAWDIYVSRNYSFAAWSCA